MTKRIPKTNALRLLDDAGVPYETMPYTLGEDEFSASAVAVQLGLPEERVFKTLLAIGDDGPSFAVVPAADNVDLKALARVSGSRQVSMAPLADVVRITGFPRGAVTVLGAKRALPVVLDEQALAHERIAVSAGAKGLQVMLSTDAYVSLTGAAVADVSQ